jgi:hypothetical protein
VNKPLVIQAEAARGLLSRRQDRHRTAQYSTLNKNGQRLAG